MSDFTHPNPRIINWINEGFPRWFVPSNKPVVDASLNVNTMPRPGFDSRPGHVGRRLKFLIHQVTCCCCSSSSVALSQCRSRLQPKTRSHCSSLGEDADCSFFLLLKAFLSALILAKMSVNA